MMGKEHNSPDYQNLLSLLETRKLKKGFHEYYLSLN